MAINKIVAGYMSDQIKISIRQAYFQHGNDTGFAVSQRVIRDVAEMACELHSRKTGARAIFNIYEAVENGIDGIDIEPVTLSVDLAALLNMTAATSQATGPANVSPPPPSSMPMVSEVVQKENHVARALATMRSAPQAAQLGFAFGMLAIGIVAFVVSALWDFTR